MAIWSASSGTSSLIQLDAGEPVDFLIRGCRIFANCLTALLPDLHRSHVRMRGIGSGYIRVFEGSCVHINDVEVGPLC